MKTNFVSTHVSDRLYYYFFFWYGGCDVSVLWDNPCHAARTDCTQRTAEEEGGGVCLPLHPPPRPPHPHPTPHSLSQTHIWPETEKRERENDWRLIYTVCMCVRARESASADFCSLSLPSTLLIGLIPSTAGGLFLCFWFVFFWGGEGGFKKLWNIT